MNSLQELLVKKLPSLAKHLEELQCDISIIATDWYLCLYCTSLPSEVVARVWDALFNEGPKVLFRVAVAILQLQQRQLMEIDSAGEMLAAVKKAAKHMHHRDKLMQVAFDGIGRLSITMIDRIREIKRQDVNAMISERQKQLDTEQTRKQVEEEISKRWLTGRREEDGAKVVRGEKL